MADAYICRRGGSGGSGGGSELVIVGGTTSPAKADHNMIWLNTPNEITSYALTAAEPETPVEGMAWITIGDSGLIKMASPVGGDWITVYPISAKQYIGGTWADVTAKSYLNGEWVDWWNGELYDSGNEFTDITGGWVQVNGTLTKNADNLTLTNVGANASTYAAAYTANMIDLTDVKEIRVNASGTIAEGLRACCLVASKTKTTSRTAVAAEVGFETTMQEHVLDTTSLTGSYYIGILAAGSSKNQHTATVNKVRMVG